MKFQEINSKQFLQNNLEWYKASNTLIYVINEGFVFEVTPQGIFNNSLKFGKPMTNKLQTSDQIKYIVNSNVFNIK